MDVMEDAITFFAGLFCVLSIILFFKIWGACNNISEIKRILQSLINEPTCLTEIIKSKSKTEQNVPNIENDLDSSMVLEIAELEVMLSGISSVEKKYARLNCFLDRKWKELNGTTNILNQKSNHNKWVKIIEEISPLYCNIGKTIPEDYQNKEVKFLV